MCQSLCLFVSVLNTSNIIMVIKLPIICFSLNSHELHEDLSLSELFKLYTLVKYAIAVNSIPNFYNELLVIHGNCFYSIITPLAMFLRTISGDAISAWSSYLWPP
ncbi:hypothetical protein F4809DRAFT_143036 [Biscogniauxia mediterranea]|nr:hypothetical protein F4809DRAFT_143036 [Biscogniauxia mediterranea]